MRHVDWLPGLLRAWDIAERVGSASEHAAGLAMREGDFQAGVRCTWGADDARQMARTIMSAYRNEEQRAALLGACALIELVRVYGGWPEAEDATPVRAPDRALLGASRGGLAVAVVELDDPTPVDD